MRHIQSLTHAHSSYLIGCVLLLLSVAIPWGVQAIHRALATSVTVETLLAHPDIYRDQWIQVEGNYGVVDLNGECTPSGFGLWSEGPQAGWSPTAYVYIRGALPPLPLTRHPPPIRIWGYLRRLDKSRCEPASVYGIYLQAEEVQLLAAPLAQ